MESHRLHDPTIRVFQSEALVSKRQTVFPALEMLLQGFFVPGKLTTLQSLGMGTSQR